VAKDKRLAKFEDASSKVIEETIRSIPELAQNYKSIKPFLTKIATQVFRTAASIDEEGHYKYRDVESGIKSFTKEAVDRIGKEFNLSKESVENIGAVIDSIATLAYKKELKVPPTSIVNEDDFKVKIGGGINIANDIQRARLTGKIEDPFGIKGLTFTGEAEGSFDQPFENVNVGGSYQVGDASTLSFGVDPTNESARLRFKTTWKKGGKVTKKRKKRKTKKYTKGCVVRTAKY